MRQVSGSGVRRQVIGMTTAFALSASLVALAGADADAAQLMPHRAVYELSGKSAGGFGRGGSLLGLLTYELMEDCDGWSVNQKAALDVSAPEGEGRQGRCRRCRRVRRVDPAARRGQAVDVQPRRRAAAAARGDQAPRRDTGNGSEAEG